jgi:hypothetical protein
MGALAQKIAQDIDQAQTFDDIKDWIWMAGDLIRKAAQPDYPSGFKEIDAETVTWSERLDLKEAALRALARNADPLWVSSMLGVLRDTRDRDLKKLWVSSLATHLEILKRSNVIVNTVLHALREIHEPVFEGVQSISAMDVELSVTEANKYLKRHGIVIPG